MKDFVFHKIEQVAQDSLTVKTAEVTQRVSEPVSEPGAIATGSAGIGKTTRRPYQNISNDPVATAPGSDTVASLDKRCFFT
jgi:hypothetical protein